MQGPHGGLGNAALAELLKAGQGSEAAVEPTATTTDPAVATDEATKPGAATTVDPKAAGAVDAKAADGKATDPKATDPKATATTPAAATDKPVSAIDPDVKAVADKSVADPKATAVDPKATAVDPKATAVDPKATAVDPKATAVDPKAVAAIAVAGATAGVDAATADKKPEETDLPAWATQPNVTKTLKHGSTGEEVEKLQLKLGVAVTGVFDPATKEAVSAFQKNNGLSPDGIAGPNTLSALGLWDPFRSKSHDPNKFVPKYRATAFSESDSYRTKEDPYAVGARSNPDREDDDGGKTYGTYQFESYVYRDMTKKSDKAVTGSTLSRFVNWKENPFGQELREVVARNGLASKEFDATWAAITKRDNKGFGKAQEEFLEIDKLDEVQAFFKRAGVSEVAQKDADLVDVTMGTVNQYGDLAKGQADHVAGKQKKAGKAFDADQVGTTLQDFKSDNVSTNFKSSPKAWGGIKDRIKREKRLFQD